VELIGKFQIYLARSFYFNHERHTFANVGLERLQNLRILRIGYAREIAPHASTRRPIAHEESARLVPLLTELQH